MFCKYLLLPFSFLLAFPAFGQWQSLEQRVTILEAKVKELQKIEPQKIVESTCRVAISNCVVYKNNGRYGLWYKYSLQLRDTVAFIYPDKTTHDTVQRNILYDSFSDGEYFDTTPAAQAACQNALSLVTVSYSSCQP